jgi:hypothetical protein
LAEVKTGVGTLIGFSTQPGNVAADGAGRNSPYAEALLRYMETPGKDISGVLISVRNDVLKDTEGKQVPWEHTSLTGQVYLKLDALKAPAAGLPAPGNSYDREIELSFWNSVKDSKSPALLQSYLERYPNGNFAGLARVMVDQLKVASLPPPTMPPLPAVKTEPRDLPRAIQTELRRVGCYSGPIHDTWDGRAKSALDHFSRLAKFDRAGGEPTIEVLEAVKARRERVCPLECGASKVEVDGRCVARTGRDVPAKGKAAAAPPRAVRKDTGSEKEGSGMCWGNDGRRTTLVPCSDPRAGQRAY